MRGFLRAAGGGLSSQFGRSLRTRPAVEAHFLAQHNHQPYLSPRSGFSFAFSGTGNTAAAALEHEFVLVPV